MRYGSILLLLSLLLAIAAPLSRAASEVTPTLKIDPERQFKFAEQAFATGEYARAIAEYQRFVHFFPQDRRVPQATYKIGRAYFRTQAFNKAIDYFKRVIAASGDTPLAKRSQMMISEALLQLRTPDKALTFLDRLAAQTSDPAVKDEALYRLAWIHLDLESWGKARTILEQISPENQFNYRVYDVVDELKKVDTLPRKNPHVAGLLALIPGAGYIYTERYHDALITLLINSALLLAAYDTFDNNNEALGAVLAFVELGFYSGSIYGSIGAAHKFNRTQTRNFIQNLKENTRVRISWEYPHDGLFLTFKYVF